MKTSKENTNAALAERYKASPKTISRWRGEGAPLSDPAAMRRWIAARKNIPRRILESVRPPKAKAGIGKVPMVVGVKGAAATLARLEAEELAAYQRLQVAIEAGDEMSIRLARKGWLEVSELLRKIDMVIEDSRRQAGELIPRNLVENAVKWFLFGAWIEFALQSNGFPQVCAGQSAEVIGQRFDEFRTFAWLNGALMSSAGCPNFLQPIIKAEIGEHFTLNESRREMQIERFRQAIKLLDQVEPKK